MFCPKCGQQIPDESRFCPKCGNATVQQVAPPPPQPQPVYQAPPPQPVYQQPVYAQPIVAERTSGMSVTALVLGIIGLIPWLCFLSVLAIIFGAVGIGQTGKDPYLKGKGMAVTGLILGIVSIAFWIIFWVWVGTAFFWAF